MLSNEQTTISEESTSNDILGTEIAIKVQQKVKPSDASKFRTYVDDVGHITMLLLSLSGRLAKVENSLHCTDSGTEKVCLLGTSVLKVFLTDFFLVFLTENLGS